MTTQHRAGSVRKPDAHHFGRSPIAIHAALCFTVVALVAAADGERQVDPAAWGSDHVGQAMPAYVTGDECLFCHRKIGQLLWSLLVCPRCFWQWRQERADQISISSQRGRHVFRICNGGVIVLTVTGWTSDSVRLASKQSCCRDWWRSLVTWNERGFSRETWRRATHCK